MRDYAHDVSQGVTTTTPYARPTRTRTDAFEDYATDDVYDPDHMFYRMVCGFNGNDYNGLNYTQLRNGQSCAGLTVDDLWLSLKNMDDTMRWAKANATAAWRPAETTTKPLPPGNPLGKTCTRARSVTGKTRFPETWDEKKIRWAVKETVTAPREAIVGPRSNKKFHVRNIEGVDVVVELVWKIDKWRVITSYPARQGAWS